MDNIELYINNALCDTADNFSIRLNRQLINPSGLNMKDAQYSYSISLPPTPGNSEIFSYADVEETKNKFISHYTAEVIVNSYPIFKGKFMLSEISRNGFKGNLYLPAPSEIKTIFGEKKLNESAPLYLSGFADTVEAVNRVNKNAANDVQECIFPLVLFGVIPKTKTSNNRDRHVWTTDSYWTFNHLLPSPNVLRILKHLFNSEGYQLTGNVFDDERLTSLYMSYHNPPGYRKEWNWCDINKIAIAGEWSNYKKDNEGIFSYDSKMNRIGKIFSANLLNASFTKITSTTDPGNNIETKTDNSHRVRIPADGYYRVEMSGNLAMAREYKVIEKDGLKIQVGFYDYDSSTHIAYTGLMQRHYETTAGENYDNTFNRKRYEIQVLRDFATGNFNTTTIAGCYNGAQFSNHNNTANNSYPRYYPHKKGALMVDPGVNPNLICGLHWGQSETDFNPAAGYEKCNYMIIANGNSWDSTKKRDDKIRCAYNSCAGNGSDNNYWRYNAANSRTSEKVRCGKLIGTQPNANAITEQGHFLGEGHTECVIWLARGEELTLNFVGDSSDYWQSDSFNAREAAVALSNITFGLTVTPFHPEQEWCNFDLGGNYDPLNPIALSDTPYLPGKIDLARFLPSEMGIDDFIDNFCKAFNLLLTQTGEKSFVLHKKDSKKHIAGEYIDLDRYTDVEERVNLPLELPGKFDIGFTANTDEEGYATALSINGRKDDGGGRFNTKSNTNETVEQRSAFSYNWFKEIEFAERSRTFSVPVISKQEAWKWDYTTNDYTMTQGQAMEKAYTGLPIRFWYYGGQLPFPVKLDEIDKTTLLPALVSNTLPGKMTLCYENRPQTILSAYFTIVTDADSHYTVVECYLTPEEFDKLDGSRLVKFNGDSYYISEVSGFDPLGKSKTKLKLIKIVR